MPEKHVLLPIGCFKMTEPTQVYSVDKLIEQARQLATDYKKMTGKPLPGVSNEIAEHDACKLLDLSLIHISEPTRPY